MTAEYAIVRDLRCPRGVVPAKAGTHTPCPIERKRRMGPGSSGGTTQRVKEALMNRLPIYASASLLLGLVIAGGCLAPAAARAHLYRVALDCGAGFDMC